MTYLVIAYVDGKSYLTRVTADSALRAEHVILDAGVCGQYGDYAVTSAHAFDRETMRTDTFIGEALGALPIGLEDLDEIIETRNAAIQEQDKARVTIAREMKIRDDLLAKMAICDGNIAAAMKVLGH